MRMLVLSIAAVFILAAPASAQHLGGIVGSPNEEGGSRRIVPVTPGVGPQLRQIDDNIDDGRDSGQLTKREAKVLRRDNRQIGSMQARFGRDGLSADEMAELRTRAEVLREQVNLARMRDRE